MVTDDDSSSGPPERAAFTAAEEEAVKAAYAAGGAVTCPRCGSPMTVRAIGGGSFGLGYARRREWLICSGCRRSVIFDIRRGTRL
jgi:transposase-like protein